MVIGFKQRFKDPILNGYKFHTLREDPHDRWKAGMTMHMATGVRTKQYNQFAEKICTGTQKIEIIRKSDYLNETIVIVDGRTLIEPEVRELAYRDGFTSLADFWLWFSDGFAGKIIHWSEMRY